MATLLDSQNYKFAQVLLSQTEPFTLKDFSLKLKKVKVDFDDNELRKVLIKFRENRIIIQNKLDDSFYLNK